METGREVRQVEGKLPGVEGSVEWLSKRIMEAP